MEPLIFLPLGFTTTRMIEFSQAVADNLIFHKVSVDDANMQFNKEPIEINSDEEIDLIRKVFLKPFLAASAPYEFKKDSPAESNTLRALAKEILNEGNFVIGSINICKHLKDVSKHPNIKDGDVFVIKFADLVYKGELCEAVGIYKIENKEAFIETSLSAHGKAELKFRRGISGRKLDKGCLIVSTPGPYTVFSIDNVNVDTEYWKNDFLNIELKQDPINNTSKLLKLTKSFITESLPEQFEIEKADQIDLLNRSANYFKKKEEFTMQEFEDEVLQDKQVIDAFQSYDKGELLGINRGFEISQQAVKRQAKIFKSVLKLDRNFHVYIHGNRELIEKGVDEEGKKFYKLYYKEES
jgi:37-kD nucleoid-associated bacterial protein